MHLSDDGSLTLPPEVGSSIRQESDGDQRAKTEKAVSSKQRAVKEPTGELSPEKGVIYLKKLKVQSSKEMIYKMKAILKTIVFILTILIAYLVIVAHGGLK